MLPTLAPRPLPRTRVRFVYDDSVISFHLGAAPTFGDVAWAMGHLALKRAAPPVAIAVRLTAPSPQDGMGPHHAR